MYSPDCAQQMVWLAGATQPYGQASEVLARIGHHHIPKTSIWRQVEHYGERLKDNVEAQQQHVSPEQVKLPMARHDHAQRQGH